MPSKYFIVINWKQNIPFYYFKNDSNDNISSTKAILYCYGDKDYLLVVGI